MLLVTKKKFKIDLKKFLHTHSTQLKSTLVNHELRTVSQDFIVVVCWFKILCALCKYSWIVFKFCLVALCKYFIDGVFWTDHISVYKLDLSYICIIITNYYYIHIYIYIFLIVKTHFVLCLLLSNGKFYSHVGGSPEYQINGCDYD